MHPRITISGRWPGKRDLLFDEPRRLVVHGFVLGHVAKRLNIAYRRSVRISHATSSEEDRDPT